MAKRAKSNRKTCHGHRRYRSDQEAKAALRHVRAIKPQRQKVPVRWFYCSRCRGYHLTSQDQRT